MIWNIFYKGIEIPWLNNTHTDLYNFYCILLTMMYMSSKKKAQGFLEVNRKRFWRERFCVVNDGELKYSK